MGVALATGKFWILWHVLSIARASEGGGFIFTAPSTFLSGYDENVCITFRNPRETVRVEVTVLEQKKDNEIGSAVAEITERDRGNKCFKISIARTRAKRGRVQLTIHSKTEEDFRINYVEQISIQTNPDVTFIQTDKAVYNAGHVVRFRMFTLRSDLTPVLQPVDTIWIENPNGVRLVQWLNESTDQGFINKTFQLSNEPRPGKWFIRMKRKNEETVSQSFLVKDYVLPKFSVTIKAPAFVNSSADVTICAKYMFGEPVHGEVVLQYFIKCSFSFYCREHEPFASQNLRLNTDGCIGHRVALRNLSSFAQSLIVNATVVEGGTHVKAKATSSIEIRRMKKKNLPEFSPSTRSRKFKPGLPFKGQVVLNGRPEVEERISVCLNINGKIDCGDILMRQSVADFIILPVPVTGEKEFKVFLEVKSLKDPSQRNVGSVLGLSPWYSPSGSYLQLESLSEEPLQCGQKARINVLYTAPDPSSIRFHHMVKARGDILTSGTLDQFSAYSKLVDLRRNATLINRGDMRRVMQFQFYVNVDHVMSPRSYLLVYFVREDGEVVADALSLTVDKCLPNKVKTSWAKNLTLPGSENNFVIETSSNSVCALSVTDQSTKLMSNSKNFEKDEVFKEIEKFEVKSQKFDASRRCKNNSDEEVGKSSLKEKKVQPNTGEMQQLSLPPEPDSAFVDSLQAFRDFGALVITDLDLETRPCRKKERDGRRLTNATTRSSNIFGHDVENLAVFKAEDFPDYQQPNSRKPPMMYDLRSFFPETWIWNLLHIDASGTASLNFEVPHTLTEWTAETTCLSLTKGLGVSDSSSIVTYQPFFLDFSVPSSLKRKEIFHLQVSVFNYESTDLPVKISLSPMQKFLLRSEESRSYCIKTKSKVVHRFVLESTRLGEDEIMVKAEIDSGFVGNCGRSRQGRRDVVVKKTVVKHEGFPQEEVKSGFICGESSRFHQSVGWNIRIPPDVVESSISVEALVSGDILGPSLKNVDNLITLPTGCGEQNMILLVPNLLLLDYLLVTKSEEVEPIERALKNLDLGYQRQLNYKHHDGSYSAFGEKDEKGSIWLTAFVIRYLSQAKKYIYVDEDDLNTSVTWILQHQLENGCFPMIGKIYHRKLQEKLQEEDSSKTMTAYILISLLEAGVSLDNPVVKNAIYCLRPTDESLGTYGDLLSSYALILAGDYRDSQALMMELLKDAKRSYGMLWWESDDSIESAIEMTGYGILSLVKLGGPHFLAAASDAVRWIIQHQNQHGGFVSSQDTVLALEAISKFSATLPRHNDDDRLSVQVRTSVDKFVFNISNSNRLVQQGVTLLPYLTDVHFDSNGRGCALVQTLLKYNIRRSKTNDNLKVQFKIHSVSDIDRYAIAKFQICVRYKSPLDVINMAVLEVSMVSGYYPDRSSLYEIRTSRKGVRRWEEYEDRVNFYFEDLKDRKVCVQFLVVQEVCIENAAPALIRLYDYYNTQHHTTMKYNLKRECQNGSWMDTPKIKQESKRALKYEDVPVPSYQENSFNDDNFPGFVDFDQDLETPKDGGDILPVFALPPKTEKQGRNCPHCMTKTPDIFSKLYCSSAIAVKVLVLSKEIFEFRMDLSPRTNFTSLKRTVSFTVKEGCECPILDSLNSFALLLVTPPRSFRVHYVRELHIDDSVQLYPWGDPNEMPNYLIDAISYCQSWPLSNDY